MIDDQPDKLWSLILVLLDLDIGRSHVATLGSGPLQALIAAHGRQFLPVIRTERLNNTCLQAALQHVQLDSETCGDVMEDYLALGCRHFS